MANVKLTPEVIEILKRSTVTGNQLRLPEQLDRKAYEAVNKVIVLSGGKWNRSAKSHVFDSDPMRKLGIAIETGTAVDEKKQFQAFFTPKPVAMQVVQMASVEGHTVLEPSAGTGAIADCCREAGCAGVVCVELNPEFADQLKGNDRQTVIVGDFLEIQPEQKYRRIVMNPPFCKNQDVKHVEHALKFLSPNGILVAIMPESENRDKFTELKSKIVDSGRNYSITKLQDGAFKSSGTNIKTIALQVY